MAPCHFLYSTLFALFWIGGVTQYTACNVTASTVADGSCDPWNNNIECGYDGGDCCECTCSQDRLYPCGFGGFDCLDPSASNATSECQNTTSSSTLCSAEYAVQNWVVNDTTSARAFAEAVNCTAGTFNVTWKGRVVIDRTIYVAEGTVVHLTGADSESEVDGGGSIRIFTLVDASLYVFGMVLRNGNATYGGAIAAIGSKITLNATTFDSNFASTVAGAVYLDNSLLIAWGGQATFARNSAGSQGGALVAARGSDIFWHEPTWFFNNAAFYYGGAVSIHDSIVSLSGETSFVNNSGGWGGAVYIGDNSNVSWSAKTSFANNSGTFGGAIYIGDNSSVSWSAETSFISNNATAGSGGALYVDDGCRVWWNGTSSFTDNAANWSGGALFIYENSDVSWSAETSYVNNSGDFGGAISVRDGSSASWTAETSFNINNAVAGSGAALYIDDGCNVWWGGKTSFSGNVASSYGGALSIYNNSNVSWSAETYFLNNSGAFGGAIYVEAGSNASWTAETSFNINNAVAGSGGALYIDDGCNVWWDGNTYFSNNAANWSGGALFIYDNSSVSWTAETSFLNNNASLNGGALRAYGGCNVWWGGKTSFNGNVASSYGGALSISINSDISWFAETSFLNNNAAAGVGGALRAYGGCNVWWGGNTSFNGNVASSNGGALSIYVNSNVSWSAETSFLNNSGTFGGAIYVRAGSSASWTAETSFSINNAVAGSGGALYIDDGCNVWWDGNTYFSNNAANWSGGALFIYDNSSVSWTAETSFLNNNASSYGGALSIDNKSNVSLLADTYFINNRGDFGGAIIVFADSDVSSIAETCFIGNGAFAGSGGALYVHGGCRVSWGGVTSFIDNAANWSGGALFIYDDSSVSWTANSSFNNNMAKFSGGALYIANGSSTSWEAPTSFFNNSALSYWGGAVLLYDTSDLFWGARTSFISNTAGELGGALAALMGSTVAMAGHTLFLNNVAGTDGGAAYIYHGIDQEHSLLMINSTTLFRHNRCGTNGGGVALVGSVSTALATANISFSGNSAGVAGGAVYASGVVFGPRFVGTRFVSNSAEIGGGVYTTGSGIVVVPNILGIPKPQDPFTFISCEFKDNKAAKRGGALDSGAGIDRIVNTLFVGNTAGSGGASRLAGEASLEGCNFVENSSDEDKGPAVYNEGLISNMLNCRFFDNFFNCESKHFFAFNESDVSLYTVCKDCDVECENCDLEGETPICVEEIYHSSSPGGNTTVELLSIENGYWRVSNTSINILDCYNTKACKGGVTGAPEYCLEGYEGPYCSVCSDGYTPSLGSTCNKCSDTSGLSIALLVVLGVVAFVACVAILNYMLSGKERSADRGIVARISRFIPLHSLKIIVVVWQILTQEFLDGVDLLNFDFSWVISTGCILDINFHDRLLISTLGPIIGMAILRATYTVAINRHRGSEAVSHIVRRKHLSMVLLLTFLVYSSVSTTVFNMFVCDDLDDGTTYLRVDYRINCDSSDHRALQIYAGFMVVLYVVGIPAFYTSLLFSNRDTLTKDENRENNDSVTSFADLWNPYKPRYFFYEVVECCRRVFLTGIVVFIYPDTAAQIAVALILATAFFIFSEALAPYESAWDSLVSRMGHAIVVTSLFLALLLKVDVSDEGAKSQEVFEAVLITLHATMILVVIVEAGAMIVAWKKEVVSEDPAPRSGRRVAVESFTEEIPYYTR